MVPEAEGERKESYFWGPGGAGLGCAPICSWIGSGLCGRGATSEGCLCWQWLTFVQIYILNLLCNCVKEESAQLYAAGAEARGACVWPQES